MNKPNRISREETYFEIAGVIAKRGTCDRAKVGAVITKGNRIISTGYNGPLPRSPHCSSDICDLENTCSRAIHAEVNAIFFAAKHGIPLGGSHLFVTTSPCLACTRAIIQSGIAEVHFKVEYRDTSPIDILKSHGILVIHHEDKP